MGVVNGSVNIESELDDVVCSRKTIMSVVEGDSLFVISVIKMNFGYTNIITLSHITLPLSLHSTLKFF